MTVPQTTIVANNKTALRHGGALRPSGGSRARFKGTSHHGLQDSATLRADHPAVVEGRTLFPTRVRAIADVPRVLVSGHNNAKIGKKVEKGIWVGMPIFTLTLEERATCPRTCKLWGACMGNAMPRPRRHAHGPELVDQLRIELSEHARTNPKGFVVRLHILGDFYDLDYVRMWRLWLSAYPALRVWGYTARLPGTPIGDALLEVAAAYPDRWRMRVSVGEEDPHTPMQVTSLWKDPAGKFPPVPENSVWCPQQTEQTATCGTCGLCWASGMDSKRVIFGGHGMRTRG